MPTEYKVPILVGVNNLLPTAKLGTGVASGSNYLRGDQTWAAPEAGLPEVVKMKMTPTGSQTISTDYAVIIARKYVIAITYNLTIQGTGVLRIQ